MQSVFQGDHNHGIPHLYIVSTPRNNDLLPPADTAYELIGLELQLGQRRRSYCRRTMYREFQGLHTVIQYTVKGLYITARFVLKRSDILKNEITGNVFGIDDTSDIQIFKNIVKFQSVDLGY